jgi:hypothetical protein
MIDAWEDEIRSTGLAQTIHTEGATEMVERIRATLRATRIGKDGKLISDQGGDIGVMNEVEHLTKAAYLNGVLDHRYNRVKGIHYAELQDADIDEDCR